VRVGGIAIALGRPLLDDDTHHRLQSEGAADVKEVQGGVGAPRDRTWIIVGKDRITQNRGGAGSGDGAPGEAGGQRQLEHQGELGRERQADRGHQHVLGLATEAADVGCRQPEQKAAGADHDGHEAQDPDHAGAIEAVDVSEPGGGPQSLQRPGGADAKGRERRQAPKVALAVYRQETERRGGGRGRRRAASLVGHDGDNDQGRERAQGPEHGKQAAPADGGDDEIGRGRGRDGA